MSIQALDRPLSRHHIAMQARVNIGLFICLGQFNSFDILCPESRAAASQPIVAAGSYPSRVCGLVRYKKVPVSRCFFLSTR